MKIPLKYSVRIAALASLAFLANTSVHAATILADWGGDYTSSGSNVMNVPTPVEPVSKTWTYKYSSTTAISPSSDYTAPSGKSGTFYGALEVRNTEATSASDAWEATPRIINSGSADRIALRSDDLATGGETSAVTGLIFFKKSDFLNSMNVPASITFDSSSEFKMTFASHVADVRLAVLDGTQWYLSEFVSTSGNINLTNLAAEDFGAWNITDTSAPLPAAPGTFNTSGSSFTNIQAVGFYLSGSTTSTGVAPGVQATAFSVSAIPEPTTGALILTALSCVLLAGKRRVRRC